MADVEEITQKTGNYKKFSVFLKMLQAAIEHQGESVFLDLLTYADLQALRSRKEASRAGSGAVSRHPGSNHKRYLILTYAGQYDRCVYAVRLLSRSHKPDTPGLRGRVHYPLPLSPEATDGRAFETGAATLAHGGLPEHNGHLQQEELLREKVIEGAQLVLARITCGISVLPLALKDARGAAALPRCHHTPTLHRSHDRCCHYPPAKH